MTGQRHRTVRALAMAAVREVAGLPVCAGCNSLLVEDSALDQDGCRYGRLVFRCPNGCPQGTARPAAVADVRLLTHFCFYCGELFLAAAPPKGQRPRRACDRSACIRQRREQKQRRGRESA